MDDLVLMTDISYHQGADINFNKMRSRGVRVCGMKRSEGNYFVDPRFDYNWKACQDADIIPFPYHYVAPYRNDKDEIITGKENADYFLAQLEGYESTLPIAGDVEKGMSNTPELVTKVVQDFYRNIGYPNINYTGDWFWSYRIKPWSGWKNSLLWTMSIPWYNSTERTHYPNHELFLEYLAKGNKYPVIPRSLGGEVTWDDWTIWQFSHQGNGVDYGLKRGHIDLDLVRPALLEITPTPPGTPSEPPDIPSELPEQVAANLVVTVGSDRYSGQATLSKTQIGD